MGEGHPLIILHGLFGSSDNWVSIGRKLAEKFSVYILDQRNHGESFHSDTWDYASMVNDLHDFISFQGLNRPHILGHSMGGKVAMGFALKYPEFLEKLVVADIAPKYYPVHHGKILEGLNAIDLKDLNSRTDADHTLKGYIPEKSIRQFLLKNLTRDDEGNYTWKINLPVITKNIENVGHEIWHGQFVNPVLFIAGEKSGYIENDDREVIKKLFPYSTLTSIKDAGHWLHAEKPNEFLGLVSHFLEN